VISRVTQRHQDGSDPESSGAKTASFLQEAGWIVWVIDLAVGSQHSRSEAVLSDEMNNVDPSTLADGVPGVVTPEMHSPFSHRHHPDPRDTEAGLPAQGFDGVVGTGDRRAISPLSI